MCIDELFVSYFCGSFEKSALKTSYFSNPWGRNKFFLNFYPSTVRSLLQTCIVQIYITWERFQNKAKKVITVASTQEQKISTFRNIWVQVSDEKTLSKERIFNIMLMATHYTLTYFIAKSIFNFFHITLDKKIYSWLNK